ncbi:MAG: hypothetical protein KC496_05810 [Anaerolineae bacterium]|nr:hypothetical protein [Anaerolineae bacterium]
MTEEAQILKYVSGKGWLVFSGGNTAGSEIRAQALARAGGYGTTVYISLADDGGDSLMDDLRDLGARSGYFIDLDYDSPEEIEEQMKLASFIVIETGSSLDALYHALKGTALEQIQQAYQRGAVVLLEGLAINLFGRWVVSDDGELLEGFNWVQNAFIEPESMGIDDSRAVQAVLSEIADAVAINIALGSALVLGEGGQLQLWGERQVTLSLGSNYAP